MTRGRGGTFAFLALLADFSGLAGAAAWGVTCAVPSASHPFIGTAVRDTNCTTVEVAAGTYAEHVEISRTVTIDGAGSASTTIAGVVRVSGASSTVTLEGFTINATGTEVGGCWSQALEVGGGAVVTSSDLPVVNTLAGGPPCILFRNGFETGNTLAWSAAVP